MESQPILTRFLIISDTQDFGFSGATGPFRLIEKVNVVIHCGDLTNVGGSSAPKNALCMLDAIDAEMKLVIAGNHDLDLDPEYWRNSLQEGDNPEEVKNEHLEEHATAMAIMTGPLAAQSGARFTVYASPYQPEFNKWAFAYEPTNDRINLPKQVATGVVSIAQNPVPGFPGVDIMMTHGPPRGILDECERGNMGCENLLRAARRAKPRLYCFGHIHEGYGSKLLTWDSGQEQSHTNTYPQSKALPIDFGKETLMVNAAIKNEDNKANNAPWLIDLELPRAFEVN